VRIRRSKQIVTVPATAPTLQDSVRALRDVSVAFRDADHEDHAGLREFRDWVENEAKRFDQELVSHP
jgi:hypothetical protein